MTSDPVSFAVCEHAGAVVMPAVTDYPIRVNDLDGLALPFAKEVASYMVQAPQMALAFVLLLGVSILWRSTAAGARWRKSANVVLAAVMVVCAVGFGNWAVLLRADRLTSQHDYTRALNLLHSVDGLFEVFSADIGLWERNPARDLAAFAAASGIRQALWERRFDEATALAQLQRDTSIRAFREAAFMHSAADALANRRFDSAISHVRNAMGILGASPRVAEALQLVIAFGALQRAAEQQWGEARDLLDRLDPHWTHPLHGQALAFVARQQTVTLLRTGGFQADAVQRATRLTALLYKHMLAVLEMQPANLGGNPRLEVPLSLHCDYAALLEMSGRLALEDKATSVALTALLDSERLVADAPVTQALLPIAFRAKGLEHLAADQPREAVASLEQALARRPDEHSVSCDLSKALLAKSWLDAEQDQFDSAHASVRRAEALCPEQRSADWSALIDLRQGEYAMRRGQWTSAAGAFQRAQDLDVDETSSAARQYLADVEPARNRATNLQRAARWAALPPVTGQLCVFNADDGSGCTTILLFNESELVGQAPADFQQVHFDGPGHPGPATIILDNDADGNFEIWQQHDGADDRVLLDSDQDGRPDANLLFTNGQLQSHIALSGRIQIQVPSALIGGPAMDAFSLADPYLIVAKNRQPLGRSRTRRNTLYPGWADDAFVVDYKYRDTVTIALMDEDLIWDDVIDTVTLASLPQTGYVHTNAGRAVLDLWVTPTALPEGHHVLPAEEMENVFRAPSLFNGSVAIAALVREAAANEARARLAATLATVIVPEIAIYTVFRSSTILEQFALAWIGHDLLSAALQSHDEGGVYE